MNAVRIIRRAYPNESYQFANFIMWARTPFPFAKLTAKDIYKAANRFMRANDNGLCLCEFCDRIAEDKWLCSHCRNAINNAANH